MRRLTGRGKFWLLYALFLGLVIYSCAHSQDRDEARFNCYVMTEAHRVGITVSQVFRLWDVESGQFRDAAPDGSRGECGRAQIKLSTARVYDSTMTRERLREKWTNTRIMFLHLQTLRGQLQEAGVGYDLLPVLMFSAFNRGIAKVLVKVKAHKPASNQYGRRVAWGKP